MSAPTIIYMLSYSSALLLLCFSVPGLIYSPNRVVLGFFYKYYNPNRQLSRMT